MSLDWIRNIVFFIVLLLVQVLVLNYIHLFGYATPLLYVYFAMPIRRHQPRWLTLLWCFAMGLTVDIFSDTPGVAAASMTVVGLLQPYLLPLFIQQDYADDFRPSIRALGMMKYTFYAFVLVAIHCLLFFTLEAFNFFNWQQWLASVVGSMVLTLVLILVIDNFRRK